MSASETPLKIARVITVPMGVMGSRSFLSALADDPAVELDLIVSPGFGFEVLEELGLRRLIPVEMKRGISPLHDLLSIWTLTRIFRAEKYDVVHSHTPKAGLVTSIAGFLARTPVRIHSYTGQRWETLTGPKRTVVMGSERLIGLLNTVNLTDSHAQVTRLSEVGIVSAGRISCLGDGSLAGVDIHRFRPELCSEHRVPQRQLLGIPEDHLVFLFTGRVVGDKGVHELVDAFTGLAAKYERLSLIVLGPLETEDDPVRDETLQTIKRHPRIHSVPYSPTPEVVMAASDLLVLPSYREGFPTVVLEAAAVGLPSIVARFGGADEVVVDGVTGRVVEKRMVVPLRDAMEEAIVSPERRDGWRTASLRRVREAFSQERMVDLYLDFYRQKRGRS